MFVLRHFSSLSQTVRQQRQSLQDILQELTSSRSEISDNIQSCLETVIGIRESAMKGKGG